MRHLLLGVALLLATGGHAQANCVILSTADWTPDQRNAIVSGAISLIAEITLVNWQLLPSTDVKLCAPETEVTWLTAAALQTAAQTAHDAQAAARTAKETEAADIKAKLKQSQFCETATFAQIASRIAAQKAAVQTDIDAGKAAAQTAINASTNIATAINAMTLMNTAWSTAETTLNNRTWAVVQALAECTIGPRRLP